MPRFWNKFFFHLLARGAPMHLEQPSAVGAREVFHRVKLALSWSEKLIEHRRTFGYRAASLGPVDLGDNEI
jgi:hypothetical protein